MDILQYRDITPLIKLSQSEPQSMAACRGAVNNPCTGAGETDETGSRQDIEDIAGGYVLSLTGTGAERWEQSLLFKERYETKREYTAVCAGSGEIYAAARGEAGKLYRLSLGFDEEECTDLGCHVITALSYDWYGGLLLVATPLSVLCFSPRTGKCRIVYKAGSGFIGGVLALQETFLIASRENGLQKLSHIVSGRIAKSWATPREFTLNGILTGVSGDNGDLTLRLFCRDRHGSAFLCSSSIRLSVPDTPVMRPLPPE